MCEMDNDDDFTFCQVGAPVNQDKVEVQTVIPDVSSIKIKDESLNGADSGQKNGIVWNGKLPSYVTSQKQATVGSLKFKVIDSSSQEKMTEPAENSVKTSQERRSAVRKPAPRAKVPFEKGYSPMDWLKLNQTHPDLAGNKGQSNKRLISLNEVKQHQTEGSTWTVLKGRVYNIAPYMKFHPGGVDILMKAVGKDCTSLFNKYHAWVNAEFLLEKCLVGILDDSQ